MRDVISIKNLYKSYGDVVAVNDLSFKVKQGEFFAFLGVNGAGKSTTISIMCGILKKDSGTVEIAGKDIDSNFSDAVSRIGVVFQNSVLDANLTVSENLYCRASLYGMGKTEAKRRIDELVSVFGFSDYFNRTVGKLSGGQRRKIDVARALLNNPEIFILDEPTTGLDPQTRKTLWSVIDGYRRERNMTVFLTTHYMEEASNADYIVILDGGKIAAEGSPLLLKNSYAGDYITLYNASEQKLKERKIDFVRAGGAYRIFVDNIAEARDLIFRYPDLFDDFEITKGGMDDVFLNVTGKKLSGENQ